MKKIALLFWVAILATSCNAQKNEEGIAQNNTPLQKTTPQGNWTVNKEVDEHGNVIRYDSIYSWSSSSTDGLRELQDVDPDSIIQAVRERMQSSFGMMGGDPFAGFFGNDTTFIDPFGQDFFQGSMHGMPMIDEMRKRMEAMQQQFFQREAQPLIPAVPEGQRKSKKKAYTEKSI